MTGNCHVRFLGGKAVVTPLTQPIESWAVKVYDAGQIAAYRERERQKAALVDAFYMALKANGGDQNAAKAAQREKAVQWNAVEVFNEIYA